MPRPIWPRLDAFCRQTFAGFAVVLVLATGAPTLGLAAENAGIAGRWYALDSDSLTKRALVVIAPDGNEFVGTVNEIFAQPGDDLDPVCGQCEGLDHNRKIRGLAILFLNALGTNGEYRGRILDPEEGKVYRCVVTPDSAGRRLNIRGYVGIPILGRTETWVRAP